LIKCLQLSLKRKSSYAICRFHARLMYRVPYCHTIMHSVASLPYIFCSGPLGTASGRPAGSLELEDNCFGLNFFLALKPGARCRSGWAARSVAAWCSCCFIKSIFISKYKSFSSDSCIIRCGLFSAISNHKVCAYFSAHFF
jgi:hypothetical protein